MKWFESIYRRNDKMTSYTVQYVMPVDNPESKVLVTKRKGHMTFEVPINYQNAHNLSLVDLIAASELSGLLGLSTPHNKKISTDKSTSNK